MVSAEQYSGVTFEGKDPDEVFQFYFRQHWIRLVIPIGRMVLLTGVIMTEAVIVPTVTSNSISRQIVALLLTCLLLAVQFDLLARFYHRFLTVYVVTDRKVHRIRKTLLLRDEHESIDLAALQNIHASQIGFLQNVLGFGTIRLEAQYTEMLIPFTPHVQRCHIRLLSLRERAREFTPPEHERQKREQGANATRMLDS